jgi:hypothetical protein
MGNNERERDEIFIPLNKLHSENVQTNMDDVVVLAFYSSRSNPIQCRKWRRLWEMHTCSTPTAPPRPTRYGGVVDGISSMTAWCLWWRVLADRVFAWWKKEGKRTARTSSATAPKEFVWQPALCPPIYRRMKQNPIPTSIFQVSENLLYIAAALRVPHDESGTDRSHWSRSPDRVHG